MGAQKNRLIEMVLLSTHNICLGWEIKKIVFQYALLSGGLGSTMYLIKGVVKKIQAFYCFFVNEFNKFNNLEAQNVIPDCINHMALIT